MYSGMLRSLAIGAAALSWAPGAGAVEAGAAALELSPETRELLRSEMREITRAMARVIPAITEARWDAVAEIGSQIAASFVLEQELNTAQRNELERALPPHFQRLDRKFHDDARKLSDAAMRKDIDLVNFRLYQLISSCTACHSEYARTAFPGYGGGKGPLEHNHDSR